MGSNPSLLKEKLGLMSSLLMLGVEVVVRLGLSLSYPLRWVVSPTCRSCSARFGVSFRKKSVLYVAVDSACPWQVVSSGSFYNITWNFFGCHISMCSLVTGSPTCPARTIIQFTWAGENLAFSFIQIIVFPFSPVMAGAII